MLVYNKASGPLKGSASIYVHVGYDGWWLQVRAGVRAPGRAVWAGRAVRAGKAVWQQRLAQHHAAALSPCSVHTCKPAAPMRVRAP